MNLFAGKRVTSQECDLLLEKIDDMVIKTLQKDPLDINLVINACDNIVKNIENLSIINKLYDLQVNPIMIEMYIKQIKLMLNKEKIKQRLKIELGHDYDKSRELIYLHSKATTTQKLAPLGVLFHITAGNVDGLPFISLLEGLLTGNINIAKLPSQEGGVTVLLLEELFKVEPLLKEYIYVFDYSSKDIEAIKKLMKVADAIVVWGSDNAVSAIRKLASPNTKIIEWGHKISFAYITTEMIKKEKLKELAQNICLTNQLFCSSCQGIFLDVDNMEEVYKFCEMFLPIFEEVFLEHPFLFNEATQLFIDAQTTLQLYHQQIESHLTKNRIFKGNNCSIIACNDNKLETSIMYRNIWVKPLKKENILQLHRYKNYLQTTALICQDEEYDSLAKALIAAGVVKISNGFEMSNYAFGEARDEEFVLRRYTRIVSVQNQT